MDNLLLENDLKIILKNLISNIINNNSEAIKTFFEKYTDLVEKSSILVDLNYVYNNSKKIYGIAEEEYSVISNSKIPQDFFNEIKEYITAIKKWLTNNLLYKEDSFPYIVIHIDKNYSFIPRTCLYLDNKSARVGIISYKIEKENIIHEIVHALSFITDKFSSEMLAYFADVSGLSFYETKFKKNEKKYNLTIEETLSYNFIDLDDIYDLFFGYRKGEASETSKNYYLHFVFYYIYKFLIIRSGKKNFIRYFKQIDFYKNIEDKQDFFKEIFGLDIKKMMYIIKTENRLNLMNNETLSYKPKNEIEKIYNDNLNYDIINLIFLKSYIKKHTKVKDLDYELKILNINFKIYILNKKYGSVNLNSLRKLARKNKKIIDKEKNNYNAWILRYHILTEYITIIYNIDIKGKSENIIKIDENHIEELKIILETAEILDNSNIDTKIIHGQFNAFYPEYLNTDRKKGMKLLKEAVQMDKNRSEIYYLIILYYLKNNHQESARQWIDKYNNIFKTDISLILNIN